MSARPSDIDMDDFEACRLVYDDPPIPPEPPGAYEPAGELIRVATGSPMTPVRQQDRSAPLRLIKPEEHLHAAIDERRWIVRDWLPCGVVTGLYGAGGVGKSLLAQQLQSAAACGGEWGGEIVELVNSIGFFCEDDENELLRRQQRFNDFYGLDSASLRRMRLVSRLGEDNTLMTFDSRGRGELTQFHRQLREATLDTKSRLAIVDTAADVFAGNENDRGMVRQFIGRALGRLALEISGAVLLCAHPSRSGLSSGEGDGGSTGWSNTLRSRAFLSIPEREGSEAPDQDARILSRKKANYAGRNAEIKLTWQNGVFVVDKPEVIGPRPPADEVFLDLLDATKREGRRVSDNKMATTYAPRAFGDRPDRHRYRQHDFIAAMERLFAAGKIVVGEEGPPSKRVRFIVRNDAE